MLQWYNRMLQTRPVITKTISTAVIIGMGDTLSQMFDHWNDTQKEDGSEFQWDRMRTARMCSWGCIIGPSMHGWVRSVQSFLFTFFFDEIDLGTEWSICTRIV